MSASQSRVPSATAFQLLARLEEYEQDIARLVASPFDTECYQHVSRHMDQLRLYAASLPEASVPWVEVLIRHFELTHALWRAQMRGEAGELPCLHEAHRQAVRQLAARATRLLTSD